MLRDRSLFGAALLTTATWVALCTSAPGGEPWNVPCADDETIVLDWSSDWTVGPTSGRVAFSDAPQVFSGMFDPQAIPITPPLQSAESFENGASTVVNFVDPVAYLFVESPRPTAASPATVSSSNPNLSPALPTAYQGAPQLAPTQIPSSRNRSVNPNANPNAAGGDATTYGKKPEEPEQSVERRQFLRTQSPLLKKGVYQFDVGAAYTLFESNFPAIDAHGTLVRGELRRRTLVSPFALRYGWSDRTQLFVNVPTGWRNTELATSPFTTNNSVNHSTSYGGVGDITLGATYLLRRSFKELPDAVVTISGGLPTGEKSVLSNASQGGLGTGFASLGGQLLFINTYDPFVLFWGGGYLHYFDGSIEGTPVRLGDQVSYQVGTGFALNDRVTLSTGFIGSYVFASNVNNRLIKDSQQEPARFRSAVTLVRCKRIIEPFVEIGLTSSSPAYRTGFTWTF